MRQWLGWSLVAVALGACGKVDDSDPTGGGGSGSAPAIGSGGQADGGAACVACVTDSDGDTIADSVEHPGCSILDNVPPDSDLDLIPDYLDGDSDGDGRGDGIEAGPHQACAAGRDTDGDGLFDYVDADNDNDGVSDQNERENGTNPELVDTDGDGCDDWTELELGTCDPLANVTHAS